MRLFALAILPLLVSCWWRSSPRATAVLPEVVSLAPDTAGYRVVEHQQTEQTVNGRPLALSATRTTWLTASLVAADSGFSATWTVDSIFVTGADRAPAPSAGTIFSGQLDRDGRVTGTDAGRTDSPARARVAELLARFFPLTPGGARPGAAWDDTTLLVTGGTVRLSGPSANHRTVSAWTTWAGVAALAITTESRYTLTGSGELSEHFQTTVEGSGRRYARQYVDSRGRYLGGTAADTADLEARVEGTDIVIPIRQVSVDTVEARR